MASGYVPPPLQYAADSDEDLESRLASKGLKGERAFRHASRWSIFDMLRLWACSCRASAYRASAEG